MPCQDACFPTSFLQAIQTGEASLGALPHTTAPHSCSYSSRRCWALQELGEHATAMGRPCTGEAASSELGSCLTLLRCGAARRCPTDAIVMPTSGQLSWHSHHEKPVYLGKRDAATGLQHHWKITVRQRLNSRDLNFCRLLRARPKSYRFVLELCIWAIDWNPKTGHPVWLFMFYILYSFFIFTDSTI